MKNIYWRRLLAVLIFIGIWECVCRLKIWPPFLLPSPYQVGKTLGAGVAYLSLPIAVALSLRRLLIGYALAVVLGGLLGVTLAKIRWLDETAGFLTLSLQTIPSVVWLPLALLWFGLNDRAVIFVVVIGALWTMAISMKSAILGVSPALIRTARTFGRDGVGLFMKVVIPAGFPEIISGLRLAWSFAWRSLIAGELLGSGSGLGQVLMTGRNIGDMSMVLSVMIIIGILGSIIDIAIFRRLETVVFQRWGHLPEH